MRARLRVIPALFSALLLLSSCALLPEEETPKAAPLIRTYEREAFNTAFVQRENLILKEKIGCTYVPVKKEALSFALGGEYIDEIMAQVGDQVVAGEVLAQLRLSDLEERIDATRDEIAQLELRIDQLDGQEEIALRRCGIAYAQQSEETQREAADDVRKRFETSRQSIKDTLTIKQVTLREFEKDLRERQIVAPFDGTVTYAMKVKEGEMSVFGHTAVTVADSTLSLFRAETKHWPRFKPGDAAEILVNKTAYQATVADEAALGISAKEKIEGESAYVYFRLDAPAFELESGDRGTLEIVLDERYDVLTVPKDAISTAGDVSIVYYQREDGMKAYKQVQTGLTVGKRTEVVSGLSEGESVIVD